MLKTMLIVAVTVCSSAVPAFAGEPQNATVPELRYVDFPAQIDPQGTHKHVPMPVGSRLYALPAMVVHQTLIDRAGRPVDDAYVVDAESTVTRLRGETLIVEPGGTKYHLSPKARIDRTGQSWHYVVVRPGEPIPNHLTARKPDIEVR